MLVSITRSSLRIAIAETGALGSNAGLGCEFMDQPVRKHSKTLGSRVLKRNGGTLMPATPKQRL
jgi:hypothetical protein